MKEVLISRKHDFSNYAILLNKATESSVYHTKEYVDFISNYLNAESFYLAIEENQKIVGALPFVLIKNSTFGNILNSNPYFGSYGGIIVNPDLPPTLKLEIKQNLLKNFNNFAKENDCILSTVTTSPFERDQAFYFQNLKYEYLDTRVGQISLMPMGDRKNSEDLLLEKFAPRCKRAIKGAERKGIIIKETFTKGRILDDFYTIYLENISSKGGTVREKNFFEMSFKKLPKGFCGLRYAELNGRIIAGIFQFYYKDIVEYCQPVIHHDFRDTNVTNLLVFTGMKDAYNHGYSYWNFGGTWHSQENVYNFKRSFGATDFPYYYFTISYGDHTSIKQLTVEDLKKQYPGFYVVPYSKLIK